jgi:hypothetical protein
MECWACLVNSLSLHVGLMMVGGWRDRVQGSVRTSLCRVFMVCSLKAIRCSAFEFCLLPRPASVADLYRGTRMGDKVRSFKADL